MTDYKAAINNLVDTVYAANVATGWWTDEATGLPKAPDVPRNLCLIHSEISEALEGHRRNLMDDKLPHRQMIEVELADAVLRIADLAGSLQLDLGGAIVEKMEYNTHRKDHKAESRKQAHGKKF